MDAPHPPADFRIGIDLGGTKIEAMALAADGAETARHRISTPPQYEHTIGAIADLVRRIEQELGGRGSVGIGIPGVISPVSGLVKNANSIALNGHSFDRDIAAALARPVRVANDANCFALSEAADGGGAGHCVVFGVIIGTGCGGGIVVDGKVIEGRNRVTGEWGHTPLPWAHGAELSGPDNLGPQCWCGQHNCLELWISGTGLARDCDGPEARDASSLPVRAAAGETKAAAALDRHADRLARGLAVIVNVLDPDVIVLGGGLSNMAHLYDQVPRRLKSYVFSDFVDTPVVKNVHGDSSGVRGAAWLWPVSAS